MQFWKLYLNKAQKSENKIKQLLAHEFVIGHDYV